MVLKILQVATFLDPLFKCHFSDNIDVADIKDNLQEESAKVLQGGVLIAQPSASEGSSNSSAVAGPPPISCQERTGQVSVRQSKEHHHQTGQLEEGRVPPRRSAEAEWLPQRLCPLLIYSFQARCGDHRGTAAGGRTQTPTGDASLHGRSQ